MRVGVLALQGAFAEHEQMLERLGADWFEIRQKKDLERAPDGLILPGGESTVMNKLLRELDLFKPLRRMMDAGLPVFGTCAGLILLAGQVIGGETCFAAMDLTARRNAYGRQLGSFATTASFGALGGIPMTFIRAPYIESAGAGVEVLSRVDGQIVAARQGNLLVTAFHPELTGDTTVHRYFLNLIQEPAAN